MSPGIVLAWLRNISYEYPPQVSIPSADLPILQQAADAYVIWHKNLANLPRLARYTLGEKIDGLFLDVIQQILFAGYSNRAEKLVAVARASTKLDALKFFLRLMNRCQELADQKYLEISVPIERTGKMLGGWQKQLMGAGGR